MLIVCPKCATKYQTPETVTLPIGKKVKCSNCRCIFGLTEENTLQQEPGTTFPDTQSEPNPAPSQEKSASDNVFADEQVFQNELPQPFIPVASQENENHHTIGIITALISFVFVIALGIVGLMYKNIIFSEVLMPIPAKPIRTAVERKQTETPSKTQNQLPKEKAQKQQKSQPIYTEQTPKVMLLPQIQSVRFERQEGEVPTIRIEGILKNLTQQDITLPRTVRAVAYNAQGEVLFEKEIYLTDEMLPVNEERAFFGSYQPAPEDVQWVDVTF